MALTLGITILNVVILATLLIIYLQNYLKLRASFNLGLSIFAVILTIRELSTAYFVYTMMAHDDILGIPMFIFGILETAAFSTLLWITVK